MFAFYVTLHTLLADRVQASKDRGATAVEYALMVSLIAIAIMAAVSGVATALIATFGEIAGKL